jgi:hypothetical protein
MFDSRRSKGYPGAFTGCGISGDNQQQFPGEASRFELGYCFVGFGLDVEMLLSWSNAKPLWPGIEPFSACSSVFDCVQRTDPVFLSSANYTIYGRTMSAYLCTD